MLRFVNKSIENVIYLFPNVRSEAQELPIDPVQSRFKEVPFPWILRIEQLQKLQHKLLIYVAFRYGRLEVLRLQQPQEELVNELQVRPGCLQRRLVLLGIELGAIGIRRRRQRAE